jgi:uncharacterized membrane protein
MLHEPGFIFLPFGMKVFVDYPLLAWAAVMYIGYSLGALWEHWGELRGRRLIQVGLVLCLSFLVIRSLNIFGEPIPWTLQSNVTMTLLSFLNTTKYPPSLAYVLMTLGPALLALGMFTKLKKLPQSLVTLGQVPLFVYLVHIPFIHFFAYLMIVSRFDSSVWQIGTSKPVGIGFGLSVVYLVTIGVLCCLYPASVWFAQLKARRAHPLLRYL